MWWLEGGKGGAYGIEGFLNMIMKGWEEAEVGLGKMLY